MEGGPIDYLMLDYLAEVTMSILQKQKERDPQMGYARDFIGAMESVLPAVVDRGVKVIANAGGVNPVACARAVLEVADEGVGIAPEDVERMFALYYTTRPEGTGIGLSLVYRIVQMHDGTIDVRSELGRGTTMTVRLPFRSAR